MVTFLAWKKNTPPNSRPRQIHLILALISAISTATHLKNNTFGGKLLRSRAFELDLLSCLISILSVCLSACGNGLRHICPRCVAAVSGIAWTCLEPLQPAPGLPQPANTTEKLLIWALSLVPSIELEARSTFLPHVMIGKAQLL